MGRIADRDRGPLLERLKHQLDVKLPPIPENKFDSYALELLRTRRQLKLWRIVAAIAPLATALLGHYYGR